MPSAENFEWPQGNPLFEVQWRSVTESLAGNGIVNNGDFEVTATATDMEVSIAAGTAFYIGSEYSLGAAETHVLSDGDANDDRWDTVYFDTSTTSSGVREGTPAASPEPPDVSGGELLLAVVYVPAGATNISDQEILNWRAKFSNEAEEVHYDDTLGVYGVNNVEGALDELQEAAQITAYPLAIGDLNSPYAPTDIASVNGYPFLNSDLANSSLSVNAGTGLSTTNASIGLGGSATLSIPTGGVSTSEIADGTIVDGDIDGTTTIARGKLDDERVTTPSITTNTTTSGEEVILVDTSGGAVTITLASADVSQGNFITVVDVGGSADSNAVTINTESTETINGSSSILLETAYGAQVLASDGNNWFTAGGGSGGGGVVVESDGTVVADPADAVDFRSRLHVTDDGDDTVTVDAGGDPVEEVRMTESGTVANGDGDVLYTTQVADGATFEMRQAGLLLVDGQAAPTDLDLVIATLDNAGAATKQTTVIAGDGTVQGDETGTALASYSNTSGGEQTVALIADNGQFNAGTGASQDYVTEAVGEVHTGAATLTNADLETLRANETGSVAAGDSGMVATTQLPDGATFEVRQAGLLLVDGQAAPTDLDLVIATLDNSGGATLQSVVIDGDGTVQGDVTGDPVASYTNGEGAEQTVALLVDNGNFNAGTGSSQSVVVEALAEVLA